MVVAMQARVQELCRKLKPILGKKVDGLWAAYLAENDPGGKAEIEQILELLSGKHLGTDYNFDRSPFPPPEKNFSESGNLHLGTVTYAGKAMFPFRLKSNRLKEHLLIAGRSGSGKTNMTFILMQNMIRQGIKVLALDWKRSYRDLKEIHPALKVYTIGRDVSPLRFNPLIPPPGCDPNVWIKLIVDVISKSYFGGEGVISLLVAGLDHLFREAGVFDGTQTKWPTISELLMWLKTAKLKGRAGQWKASAERILLGMTYGEFGKVFNCQSNNIISSILNINAVMEMDGLSSSSDKTMFSESITLYIYRYLLAKGPKNKLTNIIIMEEAHNLLLKSANDSKESVLENSIRMVRQYGLGYVFVDQSASLLSKVAFANSYGTIALSQKLKSDVQAIASAMNLTDEQKQSLNTLPIGTAIVKLADEYPEPFMIQVPLSKVKEGSVSDEAISYSTDSGINNIPEISSKAVSAIPIQDNNKRSHPPSPNNPSPSRIKLTRNDINFIKDIMTDPVSTTVTRYHRLNFSRRRGNAIRQHLADIGIVTPVLIATRSGQVVLYDITDTGRKVCKYLGIGSTPFTRESLEHRYWVNEAMSYFRKRGYEIEKEQIIKGCQAIDILAHRPGERIGVEVETGKSDIVANLTKLKNTGLDGVILVPTCPSATTKCQKAIEKVNDRLVPKIGILNWFDIS